ncbi:YybH family protein [Aeromonas sp. Marseille-Q5825]|uniref:YybH family protein n=1 Tax=Aeromonas sp. Marseille-Q5825 TaxID=2972767 RepID=UPI0021C59EF4|nr:SgcJ/EcaC family oxidoreductase [Aeromonas sp. Marseille-Q5825]
MSQHPLRTLIETCDAAISRRDFDALMAFYAEDAALVVKPGMVARGIPAIRRAFTAISDHFDGQLEVTQGAMEVIEGADNALVIMETRLRYPDGEGGWINENRRATYVFRKEADRQWRCTIDNSYGTALLEALRPGDQPATD